MSPVVIEEVYRRSSIMDLCVYNTNFMENLAQSRSKTNSSLE